MNPRVKEALPNDNYTVFDNGEKGIFDVLQYLDAEYLIL